MKSIYDDDYQLLLQLLVDARNAQRMTQQQVANALSRPQSFVSKIENGDRRLDVIEFLDMCRFLRADPHAILKRIEGSRTRR